MRAPNGEAPAVAAAQGFGQVAQSVSHHSASLARAPLPPLTTVVNGRPVVIRPQWVELHGRKATVGDPARFRYLVELGGTVVGIDHLGFWWKHQGWVPLGDFGLDVPPRDEFAWVSPRPSANARGTRA